MHQQGAAQGPKLPHRCIDPTIVFLPQDEISMLKARVWERVCVYSPNEYVSLNVILGNPGA